MPNKPSSIKRESMKLVSTRVGMGRVYAQMIKPAIRLQMAPFLVPLFQKRPPSIAGRNWAIAVKEIRPTETREYFSPMALKNA
jgi:hypothetical protein